ncbi:MAG: hypothetical protein ACRD9R_04065 [Pyrinomonadaceae bacterium]
MCRAFTVGKAFDLLAVEEEELRDFNRQQFLDVFRPSLGQHAVQRFVVHDRDVLRHAALVRRPRAAHAVGVLAAIEPLAEL